MLAFLPFDEIIRTMCIIYTAWSYLLFLPKNTLLITNMFQDCFFSIPPYKLLNAFVSGQVEIFKNSNYNF